MVQDPVPQERSHSVTAPAGWQPFPGTRSPALLQALAATFLLAGAAACSAAPPSSAAVTASPPPWSAKCTSTPREEEMPPQSDLTIVAVLGGAACGFDTTRLATWAGRAATIEYVDRDPTLVHNFALYRSPVREPEGLIAATSWLLAPQQETLSLPPLEAGTYYFYCDLHTRTMFGTLTAHETAP